MPELLPIQAIRYADNPRDLTRRIAPPYDVLDEEPKQQMLTRDPHNIVAVDLPVTPPKTVGPDEAYAQAGELFRQWVHEGVLKQDDEPALYAYEQRYNLEGQSFARRGLFCTLRTEPFNRQNGGIFRHEMTIQGGIDDRYKLMHATGAQTSPVFGIFSDPEKQVTNLLENHFDHTTPDFSGTTEHDGVEHRCWVVQNVHTIATIQKFFEVNNVFIADGHHRYTTALKFGEDHPEMPQAGQCLFVLVAAEDPGMIVRPTHRSIDGMIGFDIVQLAEAINNHPKLQAEAVKIAHEDLHALEKRMHETDKPHPMGLYDPQTGQALLVTATDDDPLEPVLPDKPPVWRKLDVAIAHELIIDGLIRPAFGGDHVSYRYTPDLPKLAEMVRARPGESLGLLLKPTKLSEVCDVSLANEVMPPKSTFFYPKLATGLVIHPMG